VLNGDLEQALANAADARKLFAGGDLFHAVGWRCPRARALAGLGQADVAEELARETLDIVEATDYLLGSGEARLVLSDVLRVMGRYEEAASAAEESVRLFELKGATLLAERAARARIAALRGGEPGNRAPLERT
jgi:tetratricopeptide (TPR) repeat protein